MRYGKYFHILQRCHLDSWAVPHGFSYFFFPFVRFYFAPANRVMKKVLITEKTYISIFIIF